MLARMQHDAGELRASATVYRESVDEMRKLLATVDANEEPKIDDAMDTTTPLYRQ